MDKNVVINLLIVALLLGGVVTGIFAVKQVTTYLSHAQVDIGKPQNVSTRVVGPDQAVVSWNTDTEVISLVLYGSGPTEIQNKQTELASAKTHRVNLSDLKSGTTYYYKIQVGQEVYDNEGQPWEFTTTAEDKTPKLSEQEFRSAYGTSDLRFDLNKDGVVNGFDFQLYLQED